MNKQAIREIVRSSAQPVTYLGAAMLVFIYCAVIYLLKADRIVDYNGAALRGENLVRIIEQSYSHIFKSADAALMLLRKSYLQNGSNFDLPTLVRDSSLRNELVFDYTIFDAAGRVVHATYSKSIIGADRSDLEGFRAHINSKEDKLYISKPFAMKPSGRWAIALSRSITGPDGTFAGVIATFIDPVELGKRIAKVDLGPAGAFALVSFDGFLYTRVADGKVIADTIGVKVPAKTSILKYVGPRRAGLYWNQPGVIDSTKRLISYRALESYPLVAVVGVSEAEVFRHANESAPVYVAIVSLLTGGILIAIWLGTVRERKLLHATSEMEKAKETLAQSNAQLEKRVVERTSELAQEVQRREEAQKGLAHTNRELEARVAERTAELAKEMRQREQAQMSLVQSQKMEAVGQLTAGIAHDFNNLLAVIGGSLRFVEDAAARGLTAEPELIDAALRATRRGSELVRRLLAFARQSPLKLEPVVVDQLVLDTLRLLQRTLGEGIEIVMRLDATGATVSVDRSQLENALVNLALNARDAMPEGGKLTIATKCQPTQWASVDGASRWPTGDEVCITIADNGIGIADDIRHRVFEPFFTTKPNGLGSGLGLSMVHGFVGQSGGHIEIESAVGAGTTIAIKLPRIATAERMDENYASVGSFPQKKDKTVLLIEDDPDVRVVTAAQLKQLGYKVHAVGNATDAIDLIESPATLDVALTDIVLPGGINGVELIKEAMHARPGMGILCMSGYDPIQTHREWLKVQNIEFLEKPFSKDRLAQALEVVLP